MQLRIDVVKLFDIIKSPLAPNFAMWHGKPLRVVDFVVVSTSRELLIHSRSAGAEEAGIPDWTALKRHIYWPGC